MSFIDEIQGLPASQALTTYRLPKGSIMTPVSPFSTLTRLSAVLTTGIFQGFTDSHAHVRSVYLSRYVLVLMPGVYRRSSMDMPRS
jgi:hypothetical protein